MKSSRPRRIRRIKPKSYYYTDAISDNSVEFLKQHQTESPDKPFFMYVAYTAAHWPMHAPDDEIAKFKGKYDGGYDPQRAGAVGKDETARARAEEDLDLSPQAEDWGKVEHKAWEARCMEVYAAMISRMDTGIGRIVAQLKESGQLDNTLILFLQDNGGCAEAIGRQMARRQVELRRQNGPEQSCRARRDVYRVRPRLGQCQQHAVSRVQTLDPRRRHLDAADRITGRAGIGDERHGKLERQPAHLIDLMATCVDLSQATYPKEHAGQPIKAMRGVSLQPAFAGQELGRQEPIFWEHEGNRAVRDGKWKLVAKENKPWELYDIDADRAEMNDLAAKEPERVKKMAAQWDTYAEKSDVLPLGAWNHKRGSTPNDGKKANKNSGQPANAKKQFTLQPDDHLDLADGAAGRQVNRLRSPPRSRPTKHTRRDRRPRRNAARRSRRTSKPVFRSSSNGRKTRRPRFAGVRR